MGFNITYLDDHQVFAFLADLSIGCLFALLYCLSVFLLRLLFLLHSPLHSLLGECGSELVDADEGRNGELVGDFQKLLCEVLVLLDKSNFGETIADIDMIGNFGEGEFLLFLFYLRISEKAAGLI